MKSVLIKLGLYGWLGVCLFAFCPPLLLVAVAWIAVSKFVHWLHPDADWRYR